MSPPAVFCQIYTERNATHTHTRTRTHIFPCAVVTVNCWGFVIFSFTRKVCLHVGLCLICEAEGGRERETTALITYKGMWSRRLDWRGNDQGEEDEERLTWREIEGRCLWVQLRKDLFIASVTSHVQIVLIQLLFPQLPTGMKSNRDVLAPYCSHVTGLGCRLCVINLTVTHECNTIASFQFPYLVTLIY